MPDKSKIEMAVNKFHKQGMCKLTFQDITAYDDLAKDYLEGNIVPKEEGDLTAAYMVGFEKGKDSVKVMGDDEIIDIINSFDGNNIIHTDYDSEPSITENGVKAIAQKLSGKVAQGMSEDDIEQTLIDFAMALDKHYGINDFGCPECDKLIKKYVSALTTKKGEE